MSSVPEPGREPETLRLYWQIQWERNAQFEDQRLQVSNFVIAASTIAVGLIAAGGDTKRSTVWLVAVAVAVSNVLATMYSMRSAQWARFHKARADRLLEDNWGYLADLQSHVSRPHHGDDLTRREMLQRGIHIILAVIAIGLATMA